LRESLHVYQAATAARSKAEREDTATLEALDDSSVDAAAFWANVTDALAEGIADVLLRELTTEDEADVGAARRLGMGPVAVAA
jgi:hypothetical protein